MLEKYFFFVSLKIFPGEIFSLYLIFSQHFFFICFSVAEKKSFFFMFIFVIKFMWDHIERSVVFISVSFRKQNQYNTVFFFFVYTWQLFNCCDFFRNSFHVFNHRVKKNGFICLRSHTKTDLSFIAETFIMYSSSLSIFM